MAARLTAEQRDQIAADAAERYRAGETWGQIGATHGIGGDYVRRLTTARHDIRYRRWGQHPIADVDEVCRRRDEGQTLDQIAQALGCSRQAVRTALEAARRAPDTRYPRLSRRRPPTPAELEELQALIAACPPAPRSREGSRDARGPEGRVLAEACLALVTDGVPMATLSRALQRGPTWVHWLLRCHQIQPASRPAATTARRTRTIPSEQ